MPKRGLGNVKEKFFTFDGDDCIINTGMYQGLTILQIKELDEEYLEWLLSKENKWISISSIVRKHIEEIVDA